MTNYIPVKLKNFTTFGIHIQNLNVFGKSICAQEIWNVTITRTYNIFNSCIILSG